MGRRRQREDASRRHKAVEVVSTPVRAPMSQSEVSASRLRQSDKPIKVSPLLPIVVLLMTSAQSYKVIHRYCLASETVKELLGTCSLEVGRYFPSTSSVDLGTLNALTCLVVKIFEHAIHDPVTKLILLEFMSLIAAVVLIFLISSNRSSAGLLVRYGSTLTLLLVQAEAAAVVLPIYLSFIIWKSSSSARASFMPSASARGLTPAVVVGFLVPSAIILSPRLFADKYWHESTIAAWQVFPILVSAVAVFLGLSFGGLNGTMTTSDAMLSTSFIISSMDLVSLISFLTHVYCVYLGYAQGLSPMAFLPSPDLETPAQVSHAIFAFDLLGCMVALWTLIFYDTSRFAGVGRTSISSAVTISVIGTVLIGPGGAVAWAWSNIEKARLGALVQDRPPREKKVEVVTEGRADVK